MTPKRGLGEINGFSDTFPRTHTPAPQHLGEGSLSLDLPLDGRETVEMAVS